MIHHATTVFEGEIQNWVSLDGEDWLPVNRGPVPSDHESMIAAIFNGDGNFMPLRFTRRFLVHEKATFKS